MEDTIGQRGLDACLRLNRGEWSVDDNSPRGREAERQDDNWVRKGTGCVIENAHGEKAREKRKGIGTR